jgi:nucleoside-diphosphate-sugar epimerase
VGTGARISLNQTLELLREISGKPLEAKYEPPRDGDIRDSQADTQLARDLLNYETTVDFAEGLRRTFAWYQEAAAKALAKAKAEN